MKKTFKPKMGYLMLALGIHSLGLCLLPIFLSHDQNVSWVFGIMAILILLLTLGLYFRTFYVIDYDKGELIVYFIFIAKTVKLNKIQELQIIESPLSGFRYALSSHDGILIKIGKWEELFINPADSKEFISTINNYLKKNCG